AWCLLRGIGDGQRDGELLPGVPGVLATSDWVTFAAPEVPALPVTAVLSAPRVEPDGLTLEVLLPVVPRSLRLMRVLESALPSALPTRLLPLTSACESLPSWSLSNVSKRPRRIGCSVTSSFDRKPSWSLSRRA